MESNTGINTDINTGSNTERNDPNNNPSKYINKDNFNSMSIQDQIHLVNQLINTGTSISNLAQMLGYNETTLRDRYKRAGYTRVTQRGIFVPNEELETERAKIAEANKAKKNKVNKPNKVNKTSKINKTTNTDIKDIGVVKIMSKNGNKNNKTSKHKASNNDSITGQENLLNTIELGDNLFKLVPSKEGKYSTAIELNNAVKRNISLRTNKELSRKLLTIYNFLSAVEPKAGDAINYTSIITGALSIYFDKLQAEYGEEFNKYVINSEAEQANNNHHKAIAELINMINEK